MVKQEQEAFYQKVFAKNLVQSLLPAMIKAGKTNPMNAVMGLVLKSMAKDEETPETMGCDEIISLWIKQEPFGIFHVYGSNVITKSITQDLTKDQTGQATYSYIIIV